MTEKETDLLLQVPWKEIVLKPLQKLKIKDE